MIEDKMRAEFVPDSECAQGKCANVTTGCVGECQLKNGTLPSPVSKTSFLCNATRFKASSDGTIRTSHPELAGRWVALVPAEDDCHMIRASKQQELDALNQQRNRK